jgi:hypothetical protein
MTIVRAMNFSCGGWLLSRTDRPIEKVPAAVGVPEMIPLEESDSPAGIFPELKLQLYGDDPPVAARATLYGAPTVAEGSDVVAIDSARALAVEAMLT